MICGAIFETSPAVPGEVWQAAPCIFHSPLRFCDVLISCRRFIVKKICGCDVKWCGFLFGFPTRIEFFFFLCMMGFSGHVILGSVYQEGLSSYFERFI